jgi:histidinol-phosphate aminotransferase
MITNAAEPILSKNVRQPLGFLRKELREMNAYSPPLTNTSVVNLSLNEHPAAPPSRISEALQHIRAEKLASYDVDETIRLKTKIAAREGVSPENIILCAGESQALSLLFSCLHKRSALLPSIGWSYYTTLAELSSLRVSTYSLTRENEAFDVDYASAAMAVAREDSSVVVFINPHMPAGCLTEPDFVRWCAARASNSLVLVDEAYEGFSPEMRSMSSEVEEHPNLVVAKTFSKYFGLAAIRVGYLIASRRVVEHIQKALTPFSISYASSLIASAALDAEEHYRAQAEIIMTTKDAFARQITEHGAARPYRSHANFLLVDFGSEQAAVFAEQRAYAAGFVVRSARSYGLPSFLRISVGTPEVMDRLANAIAGPSRAA